MSIGSKTMSDQPLSLYSFLFAALIATIVILIIQLLHYKKQIIKKDLKLIRFYLDKKFIDNTIDKTLDSNDNYSFLEDIKFHFKLNEVRFLSTQEFENDEELSTLFNDSLSSANVSTIINKIESNMTHRLHVFSDKKLIYIKAPYIMTNDEEESLNTFARLSKII